MILERFSLAGQVALVTGGGRGIGQGMAVALAEAGADVVLLTSGGGAEDTVAAIGEVGRRAHVIRCDLGAAGPEDLEAVVAECVDTLGRLDILVNNAGIIRRGPAIEADPTDWDAVLQVNLTAVYLLSRAAGRHMVGAGGGRVINVASMLSFQGGINVAGYTASKSAIAGLTKALANEWAPYGITVNAIAPGYIATDNTAALRSDSARAAEILGRIPAGRWGTPGDLQGATVFLASPAAAYLQGVILPVDGGWLAR